MMLEMLFDQSLVFLFDLLLQLLDLVVDDLELPPHLRDLLIRLDQVLRI